jgi:hypothetical protein
MINVIVHILNEDPVIGEIEELPGSGDINLLVKNPRRRDGKDLPYLDPTVTTVVWPMSRINFIEVMSDNEEEEIITHFRGR